MDPATRDAAEACLDALRPLAPSVRSMFGGYCVYVDGVVVGLVCDGSFFLKRSSADELVAPLASLGKAYPGAKDTWMIAPSDLENRPDVYCELVRGVRDALRRERSR